MTRDSEDPSAASAANTAPVADAGRHDLLRGDVTFLNHGSYGVCPRPVFVTYQRWQREFQAEARLPTRAVQELDAALDNAPMCAARNGIALEATLEPTLEPTFERDPKSDETY